jgi:hypothetical protein
LFSTCQPLEQHDEAGGGADEEGLRAVEARDVAIFGQDRDQNGEHDDGDFRELVGPLIGLGLAVVPIDLALQPLQ